MKSEDLIIHHGSGITGEFVLQDGSGIKVYIKTDGIDISILMKHTSTDRYIENRVEFHEVQKNPSLLIFEFERLKFYFKKHLEKLINEPPANS